MGTRQKGKAKHMDACEAAGVADKVTKYNWIGYSEGNQFLMFSKSNEISIARNPRSKKQQDTLQQRLCEFDLSLGKRQRKPRVSQNRVAIFFED
jgi:hypothetical protein